MAVRCRAATGTAACLLVLSACTGHSGSGPVRSGTRELFPPAKVTVVVTQLIDRIARLGDAPRPVVVLGEVVVAPRNGFETGDQKQAFLTGRFRAPSPLPTHGTPRVDATDLNSALDLLRSPQVTCCIPSPAPPLTVRAATLTTATFTTDRGPRTLPAWAIRLAGITDPAFVLAAPPANTVVVPAGAGAGSQASIAADQRHLTVSFVGAPAGTGLCEANYTGTATETQSTVTVQITEHPGKTTANVGCAMVGYRRQITLVLHEPLGPRLVLAGGGIVEVETEKQ
jgi:hypothetical protein